MSAATASDPASKSASKKKRKSKKKANDKARDVGDAAETNGTKEEAEAEADEVDVDDDQHHDGSRKPSMVDVQDHTSETPASRAESPARPDTSASAETAASAEAPAPTDAPAPAGPALSQQPLQLTEQVEDGGAPTEAPPTSNGIHADTPRPHETDTKDLSPGPSVQDSHSAQTQDQGTHSDTSARLDAMAEERESLRAEVAELRKSLETMQGQHQEDVSGLREEVDEAQAAKEEAETQYRTLLGKVNTIRSQLGERLKADAEELSQARSQIEELQEESRGMQDANQELQATISKLKLQAREQADEVASLRSRTNLSQSNWVKERDELISREAFAREEFESAKQAMQDWEVLAMEERSLRENLSERVAEFEEQLLAQREAYERVATRKIELRELVENSQAQLESLRAEAEAAKSAASASAATLESTQKELERALPFEKEVKEKNLLIGKLRHEAVILNDHLTKALRFLKRGKPEDNVDRQIVTNHFLHFLMLDRSDPKKFQVLQLIAALLGWTDEQREQAGLARPGASNATLRIPLSPFRRTPSTPSLSSDFMPDGGSSRESLAELWSDFLEREALEGGAAGGRKPSVMNPRSPSAVTSPTTERRGSGLGIS
ncbi:hypothetical protein MBLNU459_g6266t1 [Dothideomycetes sp. NU459]